MRKSDSMLLRIHRQTGESRWLGDRQHGAMAAAAVLFAAGLVQAQSTWLPNGTNYIVAGDMPQFFADRLVDMGGRMSDATLAAVVLSGKVTDANGTRTAQITIQAPGFLSYREGQSRSVTYDGTQFKTRGGSLSEDDERVAESFLAHFPDTVFLQFAAGGSWRRIGSHFSAGGATVSTDTSPHWTLWAFSPASRPGLTTSRALQQDLFVAVDEDSGMLAEVRVATRAGTQESVVQTKFNHWAQQGRQWFPGQIVRLENGKQVLSFQVQQVSAGPAGVTAAFQP